MKVSKEWQGKDVTQLSERATVSSMLWRRSSSCCSRLPVGLLWWGRRVVCWVCKGKHCAHSNSLKAHFVQKWHYGPCSSKQSQQESPAHHLTLFPLLSLSSDWGPLSQNSGGMLVRISCWESPCYTHQGHKQASVTAQTFCTTGGASEGQAGLKHRWDYYPIPVQTPRGWLC